MRSVQQLKQNKSEICRQMALQSKVSKSQKLGVEAVENAQHRKEDMKMWQVGSFKELQATIDLHKLAGLPIDKPVKSTAQSPEEEKQSQEDKLNTIQKLVAERRQASEEKKTGDQ